jgi:aspartate-semialdehyde dehydrogenase
MIPIMPFEARERRIRVAVLGATGIVGQTFVRRLTGHPWFELVAVAASARTVGQRFGDVVGRNAELGDAAELVIQPCEPTSINAPIIFSALRNDVAGDIEQAFARDGRMVITNAGAHRMERDVPLIIPEVNPEHLGLLERQREVRGWAGGIIANGNCAAIIIAMGLAPLHRVFGVEKVIATTFQAVSGAGYPGVPSLDILGNVVPFIGGDEEAKIEREIPRMLGAFHSGEVINADMVVSAQVNRVPVEHGHMACLTIQLSHRVPIDAISGALIGWQAPARVAGLPSSPQAPLMISAANDRPQPRRDCDIGNGMTITIGRVREDRVLDLRMVVCGHNVVRGAAGTAILNAELLVSGRESAQWEESMLV